MLKHLQSHQEYLAIQERLRGLVPLEALKEYQETLDMFQHLNFDSSHDHLEFPSSLCYKIPIKPNTPNTIAKNPIAVVTFIPFLTK